MLDTHQIPGPGTVSGNRPGTVQDVGGLPARVVLTARRFGRPWLQSGPGNDLRASGAAGRNDPWNSRGACAGPKRVLRRSQTRASPWWHSLRHRTPPTNGFMLRFTGCWWRALPPAESFPPQAGNGFQDREQFGTVAAYRPRSLGRHVTSANGGRGRPLRCDGGYGGWAVPCETLAATTTPLLRRADRRCPRLAPVGLMPSANRDTGAAAGLNRSRRRTVPGSRAWEWLGTMAACRPGPYAAPAKDCYRHGVLAGVALSGDALLDRADRHVLVGDAVLPWADARRPPA